MRVVVLLAELRGVEPSGDWFDLVVAVGFFAGMLVALGAGYWLTWIDFRSWLRSMSRVLVATTTYVRDTPLWAQRMNPRCLAVFGLRLPCSETELTAAYRAQVKKLHPDRGGDQRRFLQLQAHFEEAQRLVRAYREP